MIEVDGDGQAEVITSATPMWTTCPAPPSEDRHQALLQAMEIDRRWGQGNAAEIVADAEAFLAFLQGRES